jgi:hypothetical protein
LVRAIEVRRRNLVRSEQRCARRPFPPPCNPDDRWAILAKYREAVARQLLTPAPNAAAIAWKRAELKGRQHKYAGVKTERIERSITLDVEFLAAHPTRRLRPAPNLVAS